MQSWTSRRTASLLAAAVVLVPLMAGLPAHAADDATSTRLSGSAPDVSSQVVVGQAPRSLARAAAAAVPDDEIITFSEVPYGSHVSTEYQQRGIVFGGDDPFVTGDGANPTSPVLSGTPMFQGSITGRFVMPDGTARTVDRLVLDVGYIDSPHSVVVQVFDAAGHVQLTADLAAGGIVNTVINQPGMASFLVKSISDEPAGFAIDNVTFPSPGPANGIADTYVAMGDSYSSGQGAGDYAPGTDEGSGNGCRRSANAYPHVAVDTGSVDLTLDFRACSGAVIANLYNGQHDEGPQLDALNSRTRLVTLSIVGNDLDFGPTILKCIATAAGNVLNPFVTWWRSCERNQGGAVEDKLQSLKDGDLHDQLLGVYREIRSRAPNARVIVITYPKFFQTKGSGGYAGCQAIRSSDQVWINAKIRQADGLIVTTAHKAGFEAIDMVDAINDNEMCSDVPAINGIELTDRSASFHPNSLGHLIEGLKLDDYIGMTIVEPTFTIHQGETVRGTYTVHGSAYTLNVGWPGSDVVTTLISPSGQRYTRDDPHGAEHANGPTWEYFTVTDPEQGDWTIESYGADVAAGGEPVTYRTLDETPTNQLPTASFTTTRTGETFRFDATGSTDADGSIATYDWEFGDGATATGPVVTHTFAPGTYDVTLVTTDDQGAQGFGHSSTVLRVGTDAAAATVYSGSALTLTNTVSADGADANLYVDGAFTCNSSGHVAGDVTVVGNAYLTSSCKIDGDLWVSGSVRMDSSPRVGGDVRAGGAISFQSSATIGGNVTTGSTFASIDGRTVAQLQASGALNGSVTTWSFLLAPETSPGTVVPAAPGDGSPVTSWASWLRGIATSAHAPSWSPALSANVGCTLSASTAGSSTVTVTSPTWVDARKASTGCSSVALQGLTVRLSSDLTVVSDGISSTNGLRVVSADGKQHTLRLLVPGTVGPQVGTGQITLLGTTDIDPLVTTSIATPGTVQVNGPAQLTGQLVAGKLALTGAVTLHSGLPTARL